MRRSLARLLLGGALLAFGAVSPPARADETAPAQATPPRIVSAPAVPYPEGAIGEATVILELVVGTDGSVQDARIVEGEAPFGEAARAAARGWTFEPARRGEVAVVARIRTEVAFTPPSPPEEPAPEPAPSAPAANGPPTPPTPPPPEEVRVAGQRPSRGDAVSMGGGEVRQMPGVFGDAFRAVEVLPGVVPIASGVPYFFVRGAPPGNTGYYLDGLRVPALFHVGVGPSVVHPALVDGIAFEPGPYPARYGRFAGGIVAGELKAPRDELHGEANVRAFDAGALVESPFEEGRGTALVAGRYSYAGLLVPLFAPDTRMAYWDYQTRVQWKLGEQGAHGARDGAISVLALGSFDTLSQRDDASAPFKEQLAYTFHRIDVRYDRPLSERGGRVRVATTLGYDRSGQENLHASKWSVGTRLEIEAPLAAAATLRAGMDAWHETYGIDARGENTPAGALFPAREDLTGGAYAEIALRLFDRLELSPGVRADVYTTRALEGDARPRAVIGALEPRLLGRFALTRDVALLGGAGVAHQRPSAFLTLPGLDLGGLADGLQQAFQFDGGVDVKLPASFSGRATAFLHLYRGLTDASSTCSDPETVHNDVDCAASRVQGRAYGLELTLRRALHERVTGIVTYTLSRSERTQPRLLGDGPVIPSEFDRPHVLNVALSVALGRDWTAGARLYAYSGKPYSRLFEGQPIPPYDAQRLDPFHRLDLRLEKRWRLGERGRIAFVAEVLNALLEQESIGVSCAWDVKGGTFPDLSKPATPQNGCAQSKIGPLSIPSVGVEATF